MTTYTIPSRQRTLLLGGMVLGLVCLGLSWFSDSTAHHTPILDEFFTQYSLFYGYFAYGALLLLCLQYGMGRMARTV